MLHRASVQLKTSFSLAVLLTSHAALGQSDDAGRDAARGHYQQGLGLVAESHFEQALEEFRAAYRASPRFAVLYNIGQTCIALDRPLEAVSALEQYLRDGKAEIPAERREQVERQLAALTAGMAEIAVVAGTPGVSIELDGREIGRAPLPAPTRVTPGAHVISARADDGSRLSRSLTLRAGERLDLRLDLPTPDATPAKPTGTLAVVCREPVRVWVDGTRVLGSLDNPRISLDAGRHRITLVVAGRSSAEQRLDMQANATISLDCAEALERPTAVPRAHSNTTKSTVGYVVGAIGAGLAATAFGHYLWNLGRYEQWKETHARLSGEESAPDYFERQTENNELGSSIDRASRVTVSLAVGGGALLATGVTLVIVDQGGAATSPGGNRSFGLSVGGAW